MNLKENLFYTVYSFHFVVFILSQTKLFSFLEGSMSILYPVIYIVIVIFTKEKQSVIKYIYLAILYLIINIYFNEYMSNFIGYYLFFYLINKRVEINFFKFLKIIKNSLYIYILLSIILNYLLNGKYSIYIIRSIPGKFIQNLNRFIGIEGTPAGPDILGLTVLLIVIFWNRKNTIRNKLEAILPVTVIIWCSSFSNIMSFVLSLVMYILKSKKKIQAFYLLIVVFYFHKIIGGLYIVSSLNIKYFLNMMTTYRARIWAQIIANYDNQLSYSERIFGSKNLVQFSHFYGKVAENPHNTFLLLEIKLGYILSFLIFLFIIYKIYKMKDIKKILLVTNILIYSTTNATVLSPRGNPIIIYILFYFIFNRFKKEKRRSKVKNTSLEKINGRKYYEIFNREYRV